MAEGFQQPRPGFGHRHPAAEPVEQRPEPPRPPDVAQKRRLARSLVVSPRTAAVRRPMSPVAGAQPQRRQHIGEQREDLGIRRLRDLAGEKLEPDLKILAGPRAEVLLLAEDLAAVGSSARARRRSAMCIWTTGTVKSGRSIVSPRSGSSVT